MKTIPKWLQNWQSKFKTCYEVWQDRLNIECGKITPEQVQVGFEKQLDGKEPKN